MGKRESVFYVGRVSKIGFDQNKFIAALFEPVPFEDRSSNNIWNIVNVVEDKDYHFYSGKLNKANPDATVTVMTKNYKEELEKKEPDMVLCSSEFIYIPEYSGIAFHSIPNYIEPKRFISIFQQIIEKTISNFFFVDCQINLLDNLDSFFKKLNDFSSISIMKAAVNPPNPLFGRFWESLKEYLKERNATELQIKEINKNDNLRTKIKELIRLLLKNDENEIEQYLKSNDISPLDAAILMSLDGYGNGRIDGYIKDQYTFIKTHERMIHFSLGQEFTVKEIFDKANEIFQRISNERYMEH